MNITNMTTDYHDSFPNFVRVVNYVTVTRAPPQFKWSSKLKSMASRPSARSKQDCMKFILTRSAIHVMRRIMSMQRTACLTIEHWWLRQKCAKWVTNKTDPITMEEVPIGRMDLLPPTDNGGRWFDLITNCGHRYRYDADALFVYMATHFVPVEPLLRYELGPTELRRLDQLVSDTTRAEHAPDLMLEMLLKDEFVAKSKELIRINEVMFLLEDELRGWEDRLTSQIRSVVQETLSQSNVQKLEMESSSNTQMIHESLMNMFHVKPDAAKRHCTRVKLNFKNFIDELQEAHPVYQFFVNETYTIMDRMFASSPYGWTDDDTLGQSNARRYRFLLGLSPTTAEPTEEADDVPSPVLPVLYVGGHVPGAWDDNGSAPSNDDFSGTDEADPWQYATLVIVERGEQ